jgi:hypothetical protein
LFHVLAAAALEAQASDTTEGTRQMYYLATPAQDSVPPLPHGSSVPAAAANTATPHLGLRYNLVLVNPSTGKTQQIPTDRVLSEGDCFAIELQANRTGYLYVLAKQSSGSWTPLSDMPGQREALPQSKTVRMPSKACFEIHNPPGKETLFVVLSRDPRDFFELYESVKEKEAIPNSRPGGTNTQTQLASAEKLDAAVAHLDERFGGTRDITIAKVAEPASEDEPRGAVYVVSKKPSASIVTRIEVRHK